MDDITSADSINSTQPPEGSIWRKWDLHIHSPLTILNNQYPKLDTGEPDWEAFISKLESIDRAVVAITDYFTIDGYKKVKEFKKQGRLTNIHTILPNIEFRLNNILSSKKDGQGPRRLNFHVIFSDDVKEEDIEEHFLHNIDFYYEGNPQDKDSKEKLKLSNIVLLGKKLIEQHQPFRKSGLTPAEVGAQQAVVNHEDITRCLESARFKGKYLLVFPEEISTLIDWDGQDHHIRKGLLQKSDMIFSSNEKTRNWSLGLPPYTEGVDKFIEEFKTLKPCIHGSDAHKINEIGHPCSKRGTNTHRCSNLSNDCELLNCWIKADPTFEGLKQLLYEPKDRVLIQQEDPTPIKSNYTITKVTINNTKISEDISIAGTDIKLNSNLVAVTGGKGSGKTAFVDLIANCYKDRCNTKDPNSFVRRIADQKPNISTALTFKDKSNFSKVVCDNQFFENSKVVYIAQGELEKYIGEDSDLDLYIERLIFESPQIKDSLLSYEFYEFKNIVNQLQEEINSINTRIISLEDNTKEDVIISLNTDKKQKEAEQKDIDSRIAALAKAQSTEKSKIAKDKQSIVSKLKTEKDELIHLRELILKVLSFIQNDLAQFNQNIDLINELQTRLGAGNRFDKISYLQHQTLIERLAAVKIELNNKVKAIEDAQKEIDSFEDDIKKHANLLDRRREIETAISSLNSKISDIDQQRAEIIITRQKRSDCLHNLIDTLFLQKMKFDEIIIQFSSKKVEVLSDLSFTTLVNFSMDSFHQSAEDIMDNRKININLLDNESVFHSLIQNIEKLLSDGGAGAIDAYINEIDNINTKNKEKIKKSNAINLSDYYKFLYSNYFSIVPTVKYKNTSLSKLSLGQKATVLIKIYLAQGDNPIIIDSHDDHLDNEFIMDELVLAIRQAKKYRQVILASNNGNVVINSDAEQIIVANRVDGEISYISGSIENPKIRDRSIKVLEGGREAFKQRQLKYRLTN